MLVADHQGARAPVVFDHEPACYRLRHEAQLEVINVGMAFSNVRQRLT
jgi:hypothetical protein